MKKIFMTMVAVMTALSMSAQEKLVVNTATGSSDFYYAKQAKVSFWGQPKGEERNGDVTAEVMEVGTDYVTLRLCFTASLGPLCFHISEDDAIWEPSIYSDVYADDALVYGEQDRQYCCVLNTWNLLYCYGSKDDTNTDYTVTGLQPNTTYTITPYAIAATYNGQTIFAYGSEKTFKTASEGLVPLAEDQTIDIAEEITEETNLDGNIVGDIYYNISSGNGSYDVANGCIVVTQPTEDNTVEGTDIFGEDFKAGFTGIVFKVPAGKGTVKIQAETTGNMVMKVKIGDNDPIEMELDGKLKVSFPYNVTQDTYVYIYGSTDSSDVKGMHKAPADGELKIYGVELKYEGKPTGIESTIADRTDADTAIYSLSGQRMTTLQKGVNIIRSQSGTRKVIIR